MAEQRFPAGSNVQLKSGGPVMTVVSYIQTMTETEMQYRCRWFDKNSELKEDYFSDAELRRVD